MELHRLTVYARAFLTLKNNSTDFFRGKPFPQEFFPPDNEEKQNALQSCQCEGDPVWAADVKVYKGNPGAVDDLRVSGIH